MTDLSTNSTLGSSQPGEAQLGDYFALLKPRVMTLVVFTAFVGLLAAPVPVHPFIGFCAILFIAVGGGASGALNMWWDADIDGVMKRTAKRPIPAGRVEPGEALGLGLALSALCAFVALGAVVRLSHESPVVQTMPSSQATASPATHAPSAPQVSAPLQ